jgi:hypothetical protein
MTTITTRTATKPNLAAAIMAGRKRAWRRTTLA